MYSARSERNPREFPITDQGRADQGVFENSFPPSARPTKWDAQLTESNFHTRLSKKREYRFDSGVVFFLYC